jgi:hypothetical protein
VDRAVDHGPRVHREPSEGVLLHLIRAVGFAICGGGRTHATGGGARPARGGSRRRLEGPIRRTREGGSEWEPIKILLE